jgi:hypothetical protein
VRSVRAPIFFVACAFFRWSIRLSADTLLRRKEGCVDRLNPLATEFVYEGRTYRQIRRDGLVALYEMLQGEELIGFEVIVIRVYGAGERFGKWYPLREGYPSKESWGTTGFSYLGRDREGAERRYAELVTSRAVSARDA